MSADVQKVAVYCQGTFSYPNPTQQQIDEMVAAAADLASSGFGTVILGQWHVHEDGTIYYNDSELNTVINTLQVIPTALKQGGVQKVLITFGPFGSDFEGIQNNLESFKQTMAGVVAMTDVDGFDWDLEQDYDQYSDLLVDLTQWANGLGLTVTAAPYQYQSFWNGVLQQTNTGGNAGFAWWNLQLYGGADYPSWVQGLGTLVPDPQSFLTVGYNIAYTNPPSLQSQIAAQQSSAPGLNGGFIWRYEDIAGSGYATAQFAQAITNGLNGTSSATAEPISVPA
jgi:hypothetical protein